MAGFSDENKGKIFKSGLEAFAEMPKTDEKPKGAVINNQEPIHIEPSENAFIQSNPAIQNDYGYNIPDNQSSQNLIDVPEISPENSISPIVPSAKNVSSHTEPIINSSFFTSRSNAKESEYSTDEYIYHDFTKSNPLNHDKMAHKEKRTDVGGGATSDYRFSDKGKLKAEVFLEKGKNRTDNKGFRNKTVHFTEKAEDIFDKVKPEDNEALASFTDSKIEAVLIHNSRKHQKKGRRYADIKKSARKDISQLKKEIKAEKKAEAQTRINATSNPSNTRFADDRNSTFSNQIDVKFQTDRDNASKFEQRSMTNAEKLEQSKAEKKAASKSNKKEIRKAATVAAVSKMFDAKKNMQNQLGDMSGQVSGDLMKDGSTGILQTMTNTFKELILGAARKIAIAIGNAVAPVASAILIPVCIFFLLITILITTFSAVGGLLGADNGVDYDLDVNGDGYVYTSLSEEQIDEIITALYENYPDMSAAQEGVIRYSLDKVGCPYNQDYHGNLHANIFDCSSLAFRAYREVEIDISNNGAYSAAEECRAMMNASNTVTGDMQPGDLIFYGGSDNGRYMGIYHVAIYVGKVDGVDKMVEARGVSYGVVYCDVRSSNVVNISRPY